MLCIQRYTDEQKKMNPKCTSTSTNGIRSIRYIIVGNWNLENQKLDELCFQTFFSCSLFLFSTSFLVFNGRKGGKGTKWLFIHTQTYTHVKKKKKKKGYDMYNYQYMCSHTALFAQIGLLNKSVQLYNKQLNELAGVPRDTL